MCLDLFQNAGSQLCFRFFFFFKQQVCPKRNLLYVGHLILTKCIILMQKLSVNSICLLKLLIYTCLQGEEAVCKPGEICYLLALEVELFDSVPTFFLAVQLDIYSVCIWYLPVCILTMRKGEKQMLSFFSTTFFEQNVILFVSFPPAGAKTCYLIMGGTRFKFESWNTPNASQRYFYCFLKEIWILKYSCSLKSLIHV